MKRKNALKLIEKTATHLSALRLIEGATDDHAAVRSTMNFLIHLCRNWREMRRTDGKSNLKELKGRWPSTEQVLEEDHPEPETTPYVRRKPKPISLTELKRRAEAETGEPVGTIEAIEEELNPSKGFDEDDDD